MFHKSGGIKLGEDKFFNVLLQRNTILKSDGNSDGKTVQHAAHGSTFLGHVNKDFAKKSIGIFAGAKKNCLSVDLCFLGEAPSFCGKRTSFNDARELAFQFGVG